jgi:hypothetical protein
MLPLIRPGRKHTHSARNLPRSKPQGAGECHACSGTATSRDASSSPCRRSHLMEYIKHAARRCRSGRERARMWPRGVSTCSLTTPFSPEARVFRPIRPTSMLALRCICMWACLLRGAARAVVPAVNP